MDSPLPVKFTASRPKRGCPFGDAAPLQLKVHVGPKELSRGESGERQAREVFERTRQLLYQGAQACMDHMWNEGSAESCPLIHLPESPKPSPMGIPVATRGQMLIGPGGRLLRSRAQTDLSEVASRACSSCVRSVDGKAACSQCERPLCGWCLRTCWGCGAVACALCSTADYNDVDVHERVLCSCCSMFEA